MERLQGRQHYAQDGFVALVKSALSLNKTISASRQQWLETLCGESEAPHFQSFEEPQELSDQFVVGLVDGDGCFNINFLAKCDLDLGFHITGDLSQKELFQASQGGEMRYDQAKRRRHIKVSS